MNKFILLAGTLIFSLFFSSAAIAQDEGDDKEFEKILIFYMDGKYDKMVSKAQSYMENEKFRKHPLPYLYASMGYYEMSNLEEYQESYPKAFKDALKNASKYRKKDPEGKYFDEYQSHFSNLRKVAKEVAENFMLEDKYNKAYYYYDKMVEFDPDDMSAWMMMGYTGFKLNRIREAQAAIDSSVAKLEQLQDIEDLQPEQTELLKFALITYSEYLVEEGKSQEARTMINLGFQYFEEDEEYKAAFDDIMQ